MHWRIDNESVFLALPPATVLIAWLKQLIETQARTTPACGAEPDNAVRNDCLHSDCPLYFWNKAWRMGKDVIYAWEPRPIGDITSDVSIERSRQHLSGRTDFNKGKWNR